MPRLLRFNRRFIYIDVVLILVILLSIPMLAARTQAPQNIYLPVSLRDSPSTANIYGQVYSATDPTFVFPNVPVCIKDTSFCDTSDSAGNYRIDSIPSGAVILVATAPLSSLYNNFERVVQIEPGVDNHIDIPLSPVIEAQGEYRIVLTWKSRIDGQSVDLDANFWLPPGDDAYHVTKFAIDCEEPGRTGTGFFDSWPFAVIDVDSVDGSRPETISIHELQPGISTYAVRHVGMASRRPTDPWPPPLTATGATVEIYGSEGLVATFTVPQSGDYQAIWWKLFAISDNGDIEIFNTLGSDFPVGDYVCLFQ
jgi:hypothetical protein